MLRKYTFHSIAEINDAIIPLLKRINEKVMRHIGSSRRDLYEKYEKHTLKPLPPEHFEIYFWKKAKVNIDYHIEFERHYYSVPYGLIHKEVEMRVTKDMVEIYCSNKKVSLHKRAHLPGKHTTIAEHMPPAHQHQAELDKWTPERVYQWAENIGPSVKECCKIIIERCAHPQQGFRSCLGVLRLAKTYSDKRLECACLRALTHGHVGLKTIRNILVNKLDKLDLPRKEEGSTNIDHENIRGSAYYH